LSVLKVHKENQSFALEQYPKLGIVQTFRVTNNFSNITIFIVIIFILKKLFLNDIRQS